MSTSQRLLESYLIARRGHASTAVERENQAEVRAGLWGYDVDVASRAEPDVDIARDRQRHTQALATLRDHLSGQRATEALAALDAYEEANSTLDMPSALERLRAAVAALQV